MRIKNLLIVLFLGLYSTVAISQKVVYANKEYKIKGEKIFFDGEDVSSTFSETERASIFQKLKDQKAKEKADKKTEKKIKKEEKELKAKENAQESYDAALVKVEKETAKYERLKRKGKLSPNDEVKWLDKIAKLKEKAAKKKRKL